MSDQRQSAYALLGRRRKEYEQCLSQEGIEHSKRSYFVIRANQFINSSSAKAPANLTASEIDAILSSFGRSSKLEPWQFNQLIEAVRILLQVKLKTEAANQVDWAFWKSSAFEVAAGHASIAKEKSPEELLYIKVKTSSKRRAGIRNQHRTLIVRLVRAIRARGYAYRTEEAYEQWAVRYIEYCGGASPEETGANHVKKYLTDLVVADNVSASTQNQALNALIFLYKHVLNKPLA